MKKTSPIRNIEVDIADVSVAKNKALEPFIKTLVAPPENVMQEPLGTLVGLFSVSDRKDSSAYVVNYLASIAKKEYFLNPRRGAIESFESMLHHTNLALAEVVKNGQASWVGSLHGAIAIIEKGNIHFSLTGDAKIFLFRNDRLTDISEGLASPDAATHPLKTFVEISSGRLLENDCILFTSPEVFEIFTFSELDRNARRLMPEKKFSRFLETALRNELALGGALLLSAKEIPVETTGSQRKKIAKEKPVVSPNAWSAAAFEQQKRVEADIISLPENPDINQHPEHARFGDIYVQGDVPEKQEKHPVLTSFTWKLEDASRMTSRAGIALKRSFSRKLSDIGSSIGASMQSGFLLARRSLKKIIPKHEQSAVRTPLKTEPDYIKKEPAVVVQEKPKIPIPPDNEKASRWKSVLTRQEVSTPLRQQTEIPVAPSKNTAEIVAIRKNFQTEAKKKSASIRIREIKNILRSWHVSAITLLRALPHRGLFRSSVLFFRDIPWERCYLTIGTAFSAIGKTLKTVLHIISRGFTELKRRFFTLPPKQQLLGIAGVAFALTLTGIIIRHTGDPETPTTPTVEQIKIPEELSVPDGEKNASIASPAASFPISGAITSIFLNGKLFTITKTGVVDTENGAMYGSPSTPILAATAMDDLSAIFLLTEKKEIYTFYPVNGVFVSNSISLPTNIDTDAIGAFLTYLYVFDTGRNQILRYPRAEGGFGDGKTWLRESLPFDNPTGFAVSEDIYIHSESDIAAFFQGKRSSDFTFEKPATPLSITALCANPDAPDVFAVLDSRAKRIIIYSNTGTIIRQLWNSSLDQAMSCALSTDGTRISTSSKAGSLIFSKDR